MLKTGTALRGRDVLVSCFPESALWAHPALHPIGRLLCVRVRRNGPRGTPGEAETSPHLLQGELVAAGEQHHRVVHGVLFLVLAGGQVGSGHL